MTDVEVPSRRSPMPGSDHPSYGSAWKVDKESIVTLPSSGDDVLEVLSRMALVLEQIALNLTGGPRTVSPATVPYQSPYPPGTVWSNPLITSS